MRATDFEFRNRFWIFGAIIWASFLCYLFDHQNAAVALLEALSRARLDDSLKARHEVQAVFGVSTLLVAGAAMIRTWATAYLKADVVQDAEVRTEGLVADGPYRHLRNPLYLANILMSIGVGLMASRTGFVVIVAGILLFTFRLIGREEEQLLAEQGEAYRAYHAAVPRLWPSFRPRVAPGSTPPRWAQAWLGETWFWGFALAVAVYALTLDIKSYLIVGAAVGCYIIINTILARRRSGKETP
jgi:protein-S-isoprenylcysteine O-methyltransferase Ste14